MQLCKRRLIEPRILSQITQIDNRWNVSGEVVIATVSSLLAASKNLAFKAETTIDFAQVTDIDTSTISLILEWKRRAQVENQTIKLANLPANLKSLTQLYGVAELIN
jgi:phospholipid transport system transporter-binding protein